MITGGEPSDDITAAASTLQNMQRAEKLRFMALSCGYSASTLKILTDVVFRQDGDDFAPFFEWLGKCISAIAKTSPNEKPQLPPLHGNVYRDK